MADVALTPVRISGALQADLQAVLKMLGQADPMQLDCEGIKNHLDTLKPWLDSLHSMQLNQFAARGAQVAAKSNGHQRVEEAEVVS